MNYLFDFYGTLVTDNIDEYLKIMTESFGLGVDDYQKTVQGLVNKRDFPSGEDTLDHLLKNLGVGFSQGERAQFFSRLERWKDSLKSQPHAYEFLEELRYQGSGLAIVTNINPFIEDVVKTFDFDREVDCVVMSHKVGYAKPDERIYKIALETLGVRPEETIMVGDNYNNDVAAPSKLGIQGILFDPNNRNPEYGGKRIKSFMELL